jgi:cellulose biosynthesis protein BcsQ
LIIVPFRLSLLDILSTEVIIALAAQAIKGNRSLKLWLLMAKKDPGSMIGRETRGIFAGCGLNVYKPEIGSRIAFVEATVSGLTALEYTPGSRTYAEVAELTDEILKEIGL